jgi:hypothetical protein
MKCDRTFVVRWDEGCNLGNGSPFVLVFEDDREGAIDLFDTLTGGGGEYGLPAFAICYTVRGRDGRFVFEREFKARI